MHKLAFLQLCASDRRCGAAASKLHSVRPEGGEVVGVVVVGEVVGVVVVGEVVGEVVR